MSRIFTITGTTVINIGDEVDGNREFTVTIKAQFSTSMEGQDADGNRGCLETSIDDYEIIDIQPIPLEDDLNAIDTEVGKAINNDEITWEDDGEASSLADADRRYDEMRDREMEVNFWEENHEA